MKIPKKIAHLAVEQTFKKLISLREGTDKAVNLENAEDTFSAERSSMQSFYARSEQELGLNEVPGVQFSELKAAAASLHQELKDVDLNSDGIDATERQNMSKAGRLAMGLAEVLMTREPTKAMAMQSLEGLDQKEAIQTVREAAMNHVELGYGVGRAVLFSFLDNQEGKVKDVYRAKQFDDVVGVPSSRNMNTEHTWPKSRGVKNTPAISDLHHLYPTDPMANSRRASYPFGVVDETKWIGGDSKLGTNERGDIVFEPPPAHKGNVARALFYVSTVYDLKFVDGELKTLLNWNKEDPVDAQEYTRNEDISRFQRNRNPFVDNPELADRLFANEHSAL